ncbi:L-fuculose-phosphate aldolase [Eubacterium callanderi]|uniref:L-fuculose-phosphate aldolase n=1 Tax=Eubacterium callanderi TaxID=53442 RepID=UPI001C118C3E|nr:L-fuculose-phosphate aldolase [Eubacterium callanderi]MBU5302378.1 L-fuculose-phosphate aldolase [Eubacterium callanderi]WPK66271.1 5-deoxy-D-ribulose 1-phosphate aldolase [Eubacterium callanderi]WPK70568.1 5-deoxy-D-ribulose 1-phosphate aldolase [Eubacterium callanderi]
MLLQKEREDVVKYCQMLITHGLTKGTGGNISILNREEGLFAISPSGIDYFETEPEDIVVMNLRGEIVDGDRKPSSEHELHRIFYTDRDDIAAVVHTHSVYSTVLATLREGLPASSYLVAFSGYDVRCAEYASYGSMELAKNTFEAMKERNAAFMANHGLIAGGSDILNAFNIVEQIEQCAEVYVKARAIGTPVLLDHDEMTRMIDSFNNSYGQRKAKKDL